MEVISRAEEYLNYALKQQETYPEPISRMDYYLLSVAQEVRNGGADPNTITDAVNNYLTENPVQAMTDEQIISIINEGIASGAIEVMSEVEDGSITETKLSDDVFYNAYVTNGNYGTFPHLKYTIDYTGVNVSSPYSYKVTCKVTPLKDFTMSGSCGISANITMTETNNISSFTANTSVELEYTSTNTNKLTFFRFVGELNNTLDMVVEDLKMYVNDVEVSLTTPTVTAGTVEYYNLKGKLSNKQYVDDTVKELENKIDFDVIKDYSQALSHPISKNQLKNLELAYSLDFTKTNTNFNYTSSQIADEILTLESGKSICDKRQPSMDVFKEVVKFKVADLTTIFGHYNYTRKAFVVDCTDNKLKLCTTDLSAIQSTDIEVEIPFTLDTETTYTLTTVKNATSISATLYCESTGQSVSIETTTNYMAGYGQFGIKSYAGTTYVNSYEFYLPLIKKNPMWFFGGDSITQSASSADISNRWCSRILENYCDGDGIIWGKGFNKSDGLLSRLEAIYNLGYKPQNVVIMIGTNDSSDTDTGYDNWVVNMNNIITLIEENGGNPILCVPPLRNSETNNNIIFQMRDYLLSKPYKVIRMDLATSVDELGVEQDTTLFNSDNVHPNVFGHSKMYQRFLLDIGDGVAIEDDIDNNHTHDYSEITNTPINVSEFNNDAGYLTEHQNLSEYAKTTDIPVNVSALTNDSGYIDKTVNNLTNYYLKTETYTQEEINELLGNVNHVTTTIVDTLPTENISTTTIYLVKVGDTTNYTQHMYINGVWADLGTTQIDLTDYYNKTQADSIFATQDSLSTHTSDTDIHVTTTEKEKWNTVDNKIDKTSILTTYSSSATNEQLFGAKVIFSELAKGFNGTIRQGLTIENNDMNNLTAVGQYETVWNTGIYSNFPPIKKGATRMRIKVEQLSPNCYRQEVEFQAGAVSQGVWYRFFVDNAWSVWKKISTSTVEDIGRTKLTYSVEDNYKSADDSKNWYEVKNGICYFQLCTTVVAPSGGIQAITGMPSPRTSDVYYCNSYSNPTSSYLSINIGSAGVVYFTGGTTNSNYMYTGSYIIAE